MKVTVNAIRVILLIAACFLSFALIVGVIEFICNNSTTSVDMNLLKELSISVGASFVLWYFVNAAYQSIEF